jgi:FlaA1/EpsC-like NDP-sugar epimerase
MDRPLEPEFDDLFPERKTLYLDDSNNFAALGRRVLITGAGGSIGAALARRICKASPHPVILLDHSERAISDLWDDLKFANCHNRARFVLGDVRDDRLMESLLGGEQPDIIFHAAAFKHVPLLEENPFTAIENNGLATWKLARAAAKFVVARLFLISTDKAANARSMLGVSKRLAELGMLRWSSPHARFGALRLGNVAGSSGSVLPIFREQILRGGPVTVTHPEVTRYFLKMEETCAAIASLASLRDAAGVYVPDMGPPVSILKLAQRMIAAAHPAEIAIRFTGLRPGDKLHEDLLSPGESWTAEVAPGIRKLTGKTLEQDALDAKFQMFEEITSRSDLPALLELLREVVPEYQPGPELATRHTSGAAGADDD